MIRSGPVSTQPMRWADEHEAVVKIGAVARTLLGMASIGGGFLLLPLLIPVYVWAARRSGAVGQVVWSLLAGVGVGMVTWAGMYVTAGETTPEIWLIPLLAVLATAALMWSSVEPRDRSATR